MLVEGNQKEIKTKRDEEIRGAAYLVLKSSRRRVELSCGLIILLQGTWTNDKITSHGVYEKKLEKKLEKIKRCSCLIER